MASVYLFATLDTKGAEADFVRQLLTSYRVPVTLVDAGALGEAAVAADVTRDRIFALAGSSLDEVRRRADRGEAVTLAAEGAARLAREAYAAGELGGVLGLGGSAGTSIATAAMRALPLGVPKVMLSTLTSGTVRQFVGDKDIFMVNFYGASSVPEKFKDRVFYRHNANVTLMRTTPTENAAIGADIARKLAAASGPVAVLLPARGVSAIDREGQPFDDPEASRALHEAIKAGLPREVVTEVDLHINDPAFAEAAAQRLIEMLTAPRQRSGTEAPDLKTEQRR